MQKISKTRKPIRSCYLLLLSAIGILTSCASSTQNLPLPLTEDFSKYNPMHIGDSMVYIYYPHDTTDSLISEKCIGKISKGGISYYMYRSHTPGSIFPIHIDTIYIRTTSDGDVYYYEDSDVFGINFHATKGGKIGAVRKIFFSTTTPLGSFDSCITIGYSSSFPDSYSEDTYAPNIGLIYSISGDSAWVKNLIYAKIDTLIYQR